MSHSHPPALLALPAGAPSHIGGYAVTGVIGSGSMGLVYLGHDPVIDRPVAIKTLHRQPLAPGAAHDSGARRFRVEARAAGRLSHRGIVSVYRFVEDDADAYIVMEYVRGHSLADYLRGPRRLARQHVICLMVQLLEALNYAHDAGVVHRDIKPANLLVDQDGWLKITDFGIARTEAPGTATRAGALVGTPGYMAPEQYAGDAVDRRADLFACGVLLYELLVGRRPFNGSVETIMYEVVYKQHPPLAQHSADPGLPAFEPVLEQALAKDTEARFASALDFARALKALADGPVPAHLPPEALLTETPPPLADDTLAPVGTASVRAPPVAPTQAPAAASGLEPAALAGLERELARHVGPMARLLVRQAAQGRHSLEAVRAAAAALLVDAAVRERFLAGAGAVVASPAPPATAPAPPTAPLARGPLQTPEDLAAATAVLTQAIGPIAQVLVRRCADPTQTRADLVARLLAQMEPRLCTPALQAELQRRLG